MTKLWLKKYLYKMWLFVTPSGKSEFLEEEEEED